MANQGLGLRPLEPVRCHRQRVHEGGCRRACSKNSRSTIFRTASTPRCSPPSIKARAVWALQYPGRQGRPHVRCQLPHGTEEGRRASARGPPGIAFVAQGQAFPADYGNRWEAGGLTPDFPVIRLGYVQSDRLKAIAYSADLFLFPTRAEAFGLVAPGGHKLRYPGHCFQGRRGSRRGSARGDGLSGQAGRSERFCRWHRATSRGRANADATCPAMQRNCRYRIPPWNSPPGDMPPSTGRSCRTVMTFLREIEEAFSSPAPCRGFFRGVSQSSRYRSTRSGLSQGSFRRPDRDYPRGRV